MTTRATMPIVIAGPTASGKSALALSLAVRLGGEIVCADSRQIYDGMRIASAAPSDDERARVPHHLYGSVGDDVMTAGAWSAHADALLHDIRERGRVPIFVGGTGLYLRAWRVGIKDRGDPLVRARLHEEAALLGTAALHARLVQADPAAGAAISAADRVRVVRALEIFEVSGQPRGAVELVALPARFDAHWLLVDAPLDVLEPRISARASAMFAAGVVDEASALAARLPSGHRLLDTIGVKEAIDVAAGLSSTTAAIERTTLRTRQYARRQRTWFKKEGWWQRLNAASPDLLGEALRLLVVVESLSLGERQR